MKKLSKTLLAVAAVSAVSAAMAASAMAADTITATYANNVLSLEGVVASGKSQTLLIFEGEATQSVTSENANDIVVAINQEDGDTTDVVLLETDVPVRALEEGKTYQIRVGGENGTVQTGQFTYTTGGEEPEPGQTITVMIGDVDNNERVNSTDASKIARSAINDVIEGYNDTVGNKHNIVTDDGDAVEGTVLTIGDVDENDRINSTDATKVARSAINDVIEGYNDAVGKSVTIEVNAITE